MAFRKKMKKGRSRRLFSRTASMTHKRNVGGAVVMRGGIRL